MVRFTCFAAPIYSYKSKKSFQRSIVVMDKNSQDSSQDQAQKISCVSSSSNILQTKVYENNKSNATGEQITSSPLIECCWKSEEMNSSEDSMDLMMVHFKKSQSLGSGLDREGHASFDADEDEDHGLSCGDDSPDKDCDMLFNTCDHNRSTESLNDKESGGNFLGESMQPVLVEAMLKKDELVHAKSIFSISDSQQMENGEQEEFSTHLSMGYLGNSGYHTPSEPAKVERIGKSCSLPDTNIAIASKNEYFQSEFVGPRSKSLEGLNRVDAGHEGLCSNVTFSRLKGASLPRLSHTCGTASSYQEVLPEDCVLSDQSIDSYEDGNEVRGHISRGKKLACDTEFRDTSGSHNFTSSMKESALSEIEEVDAISIPEDESSLYKWSHLSNKEFNNMRIEDWVNKIHLHNDSLLHDEEGESSSSAPDTKNDPDLKSGMNAGNLDIRIAPDKFISSLSAMSTTAQMANLGFSAIPLMSAYTSLRVLNLSGNAIVRITAGALPRGLHVLNLSKNKITAIEGLRELTRLRVLDISYNRICKIGHGLASCSSLKELYLTGNRISEVEGLHRLLKLTILDLRFNKISTAKSLDQLAANYGSLQAINLEGNPAQRNVGEEQLKKYLVGLLPNLVYFNRPIIRNSTVKDIAAYRLDRSLRSENKPGQRGNHGPATHKSSSSSVHGRSSQPAGSPKLSKNRHGRLPPSGLRGNHQQVDMASIKIGSRSSHSIRRSRSEGNL